MTRREKLQEQYEDALFALLMDDLAVEEGKKAYEENKRLKADSSFEVPSESRKRCVETIARCCRKKTISRYQQSVLSCVFKSGSYCYADDHACHSCFCRIADTSRKRDEPSC